MPAEKSVIYLLFSLVQTPKKTKEFLVTPNDYAQTVLGRVYFWPRWRKYVFEPAAGTIYDQLCFMKIANFCLEQTILWQEEVKNRRNSNA